ncbi:Metalloenzyme, LuxS/M16 peptidase-like protein [Epithele typhae]|uniref:Metalloenzyme, LuxS/M16 peptidase-like protein n=1 Tax=Epithele typhae TaxID=378194 RepID=UPI002008CE20|nr:Metalloenzyme, LuxS/M16 peptidase-like protein [Epithele typhae]KAH9941151.1 Metalloenzyme, LuxS/M16 peptidase-like protein [Epithele typhae]
MPDGTPPHVPVLKRPLEVYENFDLLARVKVDFADLEVSKWRSRVTGLGVVHIDCDTPLVNGQFTLATEAFDDKGCPHTLEHLIFMGSEKYEYKGVLGNLATRSFSTGTNASTYVDHTTYTICTAGEQGFLQLLPVYVDHILYPTLTDAAFLTEVHHVDGNGTDSGVVYCEMKGCDNTLSDHLDRLLNPIGSAYRSKTGGRVEALRQLTVEEVREYHRQYYVPHNLTLVVTGKLTSGTVSLLSVVQNEIEPSIIAHGQAHGPCPDGWIRPFLETPTADRPTFTETVVEMIDFPEKDETAGEVKIGFRGPPPLAFLERGALRMLHTYLSGSPIAPLNKEYVEIEKPLCTAISFYIYEFASACDLLVNANAVPTEHLADFDRLLRASLARIADEGLDMERMERVLAREAREARNSLESNRGGYFLEEVATDVLYGAPDGSDLAGSLDQMTMLKTLKTWTSEQWVALLRKYYVDPHYAAILGRPSKDAADRLHREEAARVEDQQEQLGDDGRAECARKLDEAREWLERPIPEEIITAFPVPDMDRIAWLKVQSAREGPETSTWRTEPEKSGEEASASDEPPLPRAAREYVDGSVQGNQELARHVAASGVPLPFSVDYEHVKSDFIIINLYLSLAHLPSRLRPYLSLYRDYVVRGLETDTASFWMNTNSFGDTLRVGVTVERDMYKAGVTWLRDALYECEFDVSSAATIDAYRRDGSSVLVSTYNQTLYDETLCLNTDAVLAQVEFLPKVIAQLKEEPEEVVKIFEEIRNHLNDTNSLRVSVLGDILGTPEPRKPWMEAFADSWMVPCGSTAELAAIRLSREGCSVLGNQPSKTGIVVSLPTVESTFAYVKSIRGSGLAYGAYCWADQEDGFLALDLYRSTNVVEAYQRAAKIIADLADGTVPLSDILLDSAKSSAVFQTVNSVSTPGCAAFSSFINLSLKGVPREHNRTVLDECLRMTREDVVGVLRKYFLPLFDSASSLVIAVTGPNSVGTIAGALEESGFEVQRRVVTCGGVGGEDHEQAVS